MPIAHHAFALMNALSKPSRWAGTTTVFLTLGWHHHGIPHVLGLSRKAGGDKRRNQRPRYVESGSAKATKVQHRRHPYEFAG
jgi:hypothetical protein